MDRLRAASAWYRKKSGKFVSKATAVRMNAQRKAQMKQITKVVTQNSSTASRSHTLTTVEYATPTPDHVDGNADENTPNRKYTVE